MAGRLMLLAGPGQGGLRRAARLRRGGPAVRAGERTARLRRLRAAEPRRLDRRDRRGGAHPPRRAVGEGDRAGSCWPRPAESFGDKWRGITDVETRYRQREVDLWANERAAGDAPAAQPAGPPDPRSGCEDAGFRRGGDADPPPGPGRGRRPGPSSPTTTPSTPTSTCASRPSCTSSAWWSAGSRRCSRSAGCSATRASRPGTTPSSPCSSSTRPTPTTPTSWR